MLIDKIDKKFLEDIGMDVSGPVFYINVSTLFFSKDSWFKGKDLNDFPLPQWLPYDDFILHFSDGFIKYQVYRKENCLPRIATDSLSIQNGIVRSLSPENIVIYTIDENDGYKLCTGRITALNKKTFKERLLGREDIEDSNNGFGYVAAYYILFQFLSFLSCINVDVELIEPNEKRQKARRKKGKKPFVSYYVLKLKNVHHRQTASRKDLWSNRIHFCRGHVREYSKERPLFGKYSGRIWVPPHVRGRKANGAVKKDYTVCT